MGEIDFHARLRELEARCDGRLPRFHSELHGLEHCREVAILAGRIAAENGADVESAMLAGLLHDIARVDDQAGNRHAIDSARLVRPFLAEAFGHLDGEAICRAIELHADGLVSDDPLEGALWDADRLTLPRAGKTIRLEMLSTQAGKRMAAERR